MTAKKAQPSKKIRPGLRAQLADLQERYVLSDKAALRYADDLEATAKREKELHQELLRVGEELRKTERACDAEVAYWKSEAERHQQRVVDLVLSAAVKKP